MKKRKKPVRNKSKAEFEIIKFIKSIIKNRVLHNDRTQIKPKELDIYIPDLKLAFEFNGTYWHSEKFKNINHRSIKTKLCKEINIKLIHIEEKDWLENKDKVLVKIQKNIQQIINNE